MSRLWTFKNYSGDPGGGVWPQSDLLVYLFALGLLLPIYTITGYDASAHTSEETEGRPLGPAAHYSFGDVVLSVRFGLALRHGHRHPEYGGGRQAGLERLLLYDDLDHAGLGS